METTLSRQQLFALAAQGHAAAAMIPFVDPDAASSSMRILRKRGEEWAASVLLRPNLSARRSLACPEFPWLEDGELETLILADRAEREQCKEEATCP